MTILFLAFVALMVIVVVGVVAHYVSGRAALKLSAGLAAWFAYLGLMGRTGVLQGTQPPGAVLVLLPVLVFLAWFAARSPRAALAIPLWVLLGTQCFEWGSNCSCISCGLTV